MADKEKALKLKEMRDKQLESALELAQDTEQDKQEIARWNQETGEPKDEKKEISIAEEYRMLLEGRRVQSRRSQTQTVLEKQRQEQEAMMKIAERKQKEKMQLKKQKQKLEKLLSKNNESDGEESMLSNPPKNVEPFGPKNRRDYKAKDKQPKRGNKISKPLSAEKGPDLSRAKSEAPKSNFAGKKRKPSQLSLVSDAQSQDSDQWQKPPQRMDYSIQPKPFNTEVFSKELDKFGIAIDKQQLFAEPDLHLGVDSDDKSDSSGEPPKRNALLQNQSQTTIIEQATPDRRQVSGKHC